MCDDSCHILRIKIPLRMGDLVLRDAREKFAELRGCFELGNRFELLETCGEGV